MLQNLVIILKFVIILGIWIIFEVVKWILFYNQIYCIKIFFFIFIVLFFFRIDKIFDLLKYLIC